MVINIAVIGAGVIGLSTAINIQSRIPGAKVKVIAEKFNENTTSHGSGGIFLVHHKAHPNESEQDLIKWCRGSWAFYSQLATGPDAGKCGAIISNGYLVTMEEYPDPLFKDVVFSYRKLSDQEFKKFHFHSKFKHGYNVTTIVLDQRKYLKWLMERFTQNGGEFEKRKVFSLKEFVDKYDIAVNCSGFGSLELVGDNKVYAVRGQAVKLNAPWIKNWFYSPEAGTICQTLIIPGENVVALGSTKQKGDENLKPDPTDTKDLIQRCSTLVPSLKNAEIESLWVGLRPGRDKIRLESEVLRFDNKTLKVVHNYGHNSNGVALAWGTSVEAAELVKTSLSGAKARL